jgi:hypothetical protein
MTENDNGTNDVNRFFVKWKMCDGRYVRWHVVITTILSGVVLVVSLAFAGGRWGRGMESDIARLDNRCVMIEKTIVHIDTINANVKTILREIEHANVK